MVEHTQTIRRLLAAELFVCVWLFCGIGIWSVKKTTQKGLAAPLHQEISMHITTGKIHWGSDYEKINTAQKMKFSIKDFFSKCDQIHSFLRIWLHLLKKSFMENGMV